MNGPELDKAGRLRVFIARLRSELIELGEDEARVMRLSAEELVVARAGYTGRNLMGAPRGR